MSDIKKELLDYMAENQNLPLLLSVLANELRTPQTSIDRFLSLLLDEQGKAAPSSVNREEYLQAIQYASYCIGEIVSAMKEHADQLESNNTEE
jgi:hypothetical protein